MHEALAKLNFERDTQFFDADCAAKIGMTLHENVFPVIDVTVNHSRPIRLKLTARNWDSEPSSIQLLTPNGDAWKEQLPGGNVFNQGPHPTTGLPFVCMRGVLEYHTHSSHLNDAWADHRKATGMEPVGVLMQVAAAWRKVNP